MAEPRSSRILVLDDDPKEALTVVRALQMMGLAASYHDGGAENPAPAKLHGIRVLFLDMVLAAHGADANDHNGCAAMVVGALERLLEPNEDPLVVICWTGHPEIKERFEAQLRSSFSKNKIGTVFLAAKPAPQDLFNQDTFKQLTDIMTRGLSEHGALSLLFAWECKVFEAALLTGDRLTELITKFCEDSNSTSWANAAFRICAAMALAARGLRLIDESDADAVTAFHGALNPILNDRLEHNFAVNAPDAVSKELLDVVRAEAQQWKKNATWSKEETARERIIKDVWKYFGADLAAHFQADLPDNPQQSSSLVSVQCRGALNSMILLSTNTGKGEVCPGNLYAVDPFTIGKEFKQDVPSIDWKRLESDTLFRKKREASYLRPVLLEFSAPCDFAQAKMKLPRFVAGYLAHDSILNQVMQQAAFIRLLGPLLISETNSKIEGIFWLVLNSHFVISAATESAMKWQCLGRVRSEPLADITAWATAHMARPGYVHLEG